MAVAHSIVVSAFHLRSRNQRSQALGADDLDSRRRAHLVDRLTRRIEHRGYRVTLEPIAAASFFIFTIVEGVIFNRALCLGPLFGRLAFRSQFSYKQLKARGIGGTVAVRMANMQ